MKKYFALLSCALMALTACENNALEESTVMNPANVNDPQEVTLTFSPYEQEAMTRAGGEATSIATIATRLDVWLYQDGQEVQAVHQTSADADFGTVALTLDKRKTYTLYALAHRSAEATTLEDGIARWKDEKVTHTFYCTETFTPAETTALDCLMKRIVGQFRLDITDDIPAAVKTLRFNIPQTATRYNIVTQENTNVTDRTTDISYGGTSATFNLYLLAQDDATTPFDITVTAIDQDGNTLQQRTFSQVPIQNGYQTTYKGQFFTDSGIAASFTVDDWQAFDTVEF